MSYCTPQDLIDRYGEEELIQLTDREGTGDIHDQRLADAITDASATIDSRLGGRYALPISPVPTVLEKLACELALLNLYENARQLDGAMREDRQALLRELDAIGSGRIAIGIDAAGGTPDSQNTAQMTSGGNVFNRKDNSFI
jgi:phage gp36-like protein